MYRNRGFTLVELALTVVIGAVLVSLAMPSMQRMVRSSNVTAEVNRLVGSINLARSEAVKRNAAVSVASKGSGTDYSDGWWVFVDVDSPNSGNTVYSPGNDILVEDADPADVRVNISVSPTQRWISYGGSGFLREDVPSIDIWVCADDASSAAEQRHITISRSGRPSVEEPDEMNGGC